MEHKFRDILEHDMDMLILEEFTCSNKFAKIFLNKVGIDNAIVISTWQSKTDNELGESDMTVVFDCDGKKIALLIEDKIDAIAMPEQPSRYSLRGDKGIQDGDYDNYYVFIVAPRQYLDINEKAKEYPNRVSYEELKDVVFNNKGICSSISQYYKLLLEEVGIKSYCVICDDGTPVNHELSLVYDKDSGSYSFDDVTSVIVKRGTEEEFFDYDLEYAKSKNQGKKKIMENEEFYILSEDYINYLLSREKSPIQTTILLAK